MDELREEMLKTLSFLEPMSLEMIFLDLDQKFVEAHPQLKTEDLLELLQDLEQKKLVTRSKEENQSYWIKNYPRRKKWWEFWR